MLCLCHYGPALLRFSFQTDLYLSDNSASYLKIQAGKTSSYRGHALVKLYVQFLCSDLICKVNLSNAKKSARFVFQEFVFLA